MFNKSKYKIGQTVKIVGTAQEAVVMATKIKLRNWKLIEHYEVMYQRDNGGMTTLYWLHPDSLKETRCKLI